MILLVDLCLSCTSMHMDIHAQEKGWASQILSSPSLSSGSTSVDLTNTLDQKDVGKNSCVSTEYDSLGNTI